MNILRLVDYKEGISTSSIIERCAQLFDKRKKLQKKNVIPSSGPEIVTCVSKFIIRRVFNSVTTFYRPGF